MGAAVAAFMVVAAPCVAAVPSTPAPVSADIIPGQSIGPAQLGMTVNQAMAALGPSMEVERGRRWYPRFNVAVDFVAGVAVRITTISGKYRTPGGAGVGTADTEAAQMVGDANFVTTTSGRDTTVLYAFQGVGFIFQGGRAVQTFVTAAVPFGPPKASVITPVSPAGAPILLPGGPPLPPAGSGSLLMPAPPSGASPVGPAPSAGSQRASLRNLSAAVLSVGGLTVAGEVANTGAVPIGPIVVAGAFTRASGDEVDKTLTIPGPLAPGGSASFTLQAAMVADIIIRFQVTATAPGGAVLATEPAQAVPVSAYASFAQRQIHVKIDLGAPATVSGPPQIQALVSVADTGAIPAQWVQQVTVTVPYVSNGAAGSTEVQVRPGEMLTILVPAGATIGAPQVTGVVLSGQ
ncbi:MAG TPA: hypothetical protein VJT33_15160 [bacterium]|nr:hypothetical protein [bacterium]